MNISNLQYSVRDLIKQDARLTSQSQKKAEEAVHCWIVNLVREEALEEKVALLSRRCMTRFLESLDQDSLPGVCVVAGLAGLPDPGTGEAAAMLAELQLS